MGKKMWIWLKKRLPKLIFSIRMSQTSRNGRVSQSIKTGRIFSFGRVSISQTNKVNDLSQSVEIR